MNYRDTLARPDTSFDCSLDKTLSHSAADIFEIYPAENNEEWLVR
jgi:hypothetical protein